MPSLLEHLVSFLTSPVRLVLSIVGFPGKQSNPQRRLPRIYVHAEDPELNRRYENEMASYKEEAEGTYCPMCMDLDCLKTPPRERGARAPGAVSLEMRNILEFREKGDAGCPICAMICGASEMLFGSASIDGSGSDDEILVKISIGFRPMIELQFDRPREQKKNELPTIYQLYTPADSIGGGIPLTAFLEGRDVDADSGSDACFAFAKSCLEHCLENHKICRETATASISPTRLVYLGSSNSEIKLVEPSSGTITRFAALSYCWGKTVPIVTKTGTIAARKAGLEWNTLPPVFQDAVTVTRNMGLQYLWIDSLCIIQDSPEDWQIESSRMADIYQGAHFTIAVGSSDSCGIPFLKSRPRKGPAHPMTLKTDGRDGNSYCLKAREPAPPHHTDDEPLNTRAWTYQERILSSRILHYTTNELV